MASLFRIAVIASGLSVGIAHAETSRAATVQAVASATILRPVVLRTNGGASRLEPSPERSAQVAARKVERACDPGKPGRCMLIVYDLP